jgi:hypothetical protein
MAARGAVSRQPATLRRRLPGQRRLPPAGRAPWLATCGSPPPAPATGPWRPLPPSAGVELSVAAALLPSAAPCWLSEAPPSPPPSPGAAAENFTVTTWPLLGPPILTRLLLGLNSILLMPGLAACSAAFSRSSASFSACVARAGAVRGAGCGDTRRVLLAATPHASCHAPLMGTPATVAPGPVCARLWQQQLSCAPSMVLQLRVAAEDCLPPLPWPEPRLWQGRGSSLPGGPCGCCPPPTPHTRPHLVLLHMLDVLRHSLEDLQGRPSRAGTPIWAVDHAPPECATSRRGRGGSAGGRSHSIATPACCTVIVGSAEAGAGVHGAGSGVPRCWVRHTLSSAARRASSTLGGTGSASPVAGRDVEAGRELVLAPLMIASHYHRCDHTVCPAAARSAGAAVTPAGHWPNGSLYWRRQAANGMHGVLRRLGNLIGP